MAGFVQVGEYFDRGSADVICSVLNGHRIPAKVMADDMGGMRPDLAFMGRIRVLVPADQLEEARALLLDVNTEFAGDMADNEAEFELNERGKPLYVQNLNVKRAYFSAVYGLFVLPIISQIYATFLLQRSFKDWHILHVKDKRRFLIAATVIVGVALGVIALAASRMKSP